MGAFEGLGVPLASSVACENWKALKVSAEMGEGMTKPVSCLRL